jgi:uncharacterized protein (TIGR03382 family)
VLLGVWYVFSPSGFHTFLRFRQGTGFQIEGIVGSVALVAGAKATTASNTWIVEPGRWKWVDPASTLAWAVLVLVVVLVARRRGRYRVVDLTGAFVASLLLASRLLSPQFLSWLLPFAALAWAARERLVGGLYAASVGITMLYLCYYEDLVNGSTFWAAAVVVRNVLLLVMTVRMFQRGLAPEPGTG